MLAGWDRDGSGIGPPTVPNVVQDDFSGLAAGDGLARAAEPSAKHAIVAVISFIERCTY
jgi:hypothetical protein